MQWEESEDNRDSGQVEDRRGMKPAAMALGGGGIVVLLLAYFLGIDPKKIAPLVQGAGGGAAQQPQGGPPAAPDKHSKFANFMMNNTERVWTQVFAASNKRDRKSTRLNSSHHAISRMPSSA